MRIAWLVIVCMATAATAQTTEPAIGQAVYVGDELLRDYHPTPALVTKQTLINKAKFPAVDIHCHWTLKEDPQQLLKAMDELGVQKSINLSGGHGEQLTKMLDRFAKVAPDRLLIFANIDFSKIDDPMFGVLAARDLENARRAGAAGLKIFKDLGLTIKDQTGKVVPIDDPRFDPIWQIAGQLKMPVLIHSGDPVAFFQPLDAKNERWMQLKRHPDWSYGRPGFPTYDDVMSQHLAMMLRHQETVFISAHLANSGENLAKLSQWLDAFPNLYIDLSARVPELGRQPYAARKFLIKYQDRVLFGTDRYPGRLDQPRHRIYYRFLETDDEYFDYYDHPYPTEGEWKIYGVYLPDAVLEKIYHTNAVRALAGEMPLTAGRE